MKQILAHIHILSIGAVLLSAILSLSTFQVAYAADKAIIKDSACSARDNSYTTNYKSPHATTNYMCLGKDYTSDLRFFQFAVNLPGVIKDATVKGVNGKGQTIAFNNTGDDKLYVSIPSSGAGTYDRGMGYGSETPSGCSTSPKNPLNQITITVTGNGKTADKIKLDLCSHTNDTQTLIYSEAVGLTADSGAVSAVGNITGQFGAVRDDPIATAEKNSLYQKVGITSIKLSSANGGNNFDDVNGSWYTLSNGRLDIKGIKPGIYTLKFTYDDKRVAASSSIGDVSDQASSELTYTKISFKVNANETYDLTPDGIEYRDTTNKVVAVTEPSDEELASKTTCAIDGVGWIICPVMNFMANIVDGAYEVVEGLLITPALNINTTDANNGTYQAWVIMRNISNVAFVIAFLIIIFSQLTNVGIGNYGIKKMLPRLVIAAILVNVSFLICAIAVDLSNIIGGSMQQLFNGLGAQITTPNFTDAIKTGGALSEGTSWLGLVGFILAGGLVTAGVFYAGLSILLPALIAALVAIVTVFLVLTLRQALLIMLIVISPLAFVAFLLPNTEDLFKKWRVLFTTLLLMFPIIAFIFGASALASKIIMSSDTASFAVQVMGALVAIIPLFITPVVMKTAGGLLNRFGGVVNNPNKGPFDRMRKGADNVRKREINRMNNRAMNSGGRVNPRRAFLRRNAKVESIDQNQARELNRTKTDYIADEAQNNSAFLGRMTAGGGAGAEGRALGAAANISAKLEAEEVTAASAIIKSLNLSQSEARTLANGGSVNRTTASGTRTVANSAEDLSLRIAARQQVVGSNDVKGINDLIDSSASWGEKDRVSLSDTLSSASGRPSYIGQGALAKMRSGVTSGPAKMMNANEMVEAAIRDNVYSAAKIAAADKDELNVVANIAVSSPTISTPEKQRLVDNATTALVDPELKRTITKNLDNVRHVQTNTSPPPLT